MGPRRLRRGLAEDLAALAVVLARGWLLERQLSRGLGRGGARALALAAALWRARVSPGGAFVSQCMRRFGAARPRRPCRPTANVPMCRPSPRQSSAAAGWQQKSRRVATGISRPVEALLARVRAASGCYTAVAGRGGGSRLAAARRFVKALGGAHCPRQATLASAGDSGHVAGAACWRATLRLLGPSTGHIHAGGVLLLLAQLPVRAPVLEEFVVATTGNAAALADLFCAASGVSEYAESNVAIFWMRLAVLAK